MKKISLIILFAVCLVTVRAQVVHNAQQVFNNLVTCNDTLSYTVGSTGSAGKYLMSINDNGQLVFAAAADLSDWKLAGNAGTNTGTNFLGTTDNIGLRLKTHNTTFGYIDSLQNIDLYTNLTGGFLSEVYSGSKFNLGVFNFPGTGIQYYQPGGRHAFLGAGNLHGISGGYFETNDGVIDQFGNVGVNTSHFANSDSMMLIVGPEVNTSSGISKLLLSNYHNNYSNQCLSGVFTNHAGDTGMVINGYLDSLSILFKPDVGYLNLYNTNALLQGSLDAAPQGLGNVDFRVQSDGQVIYNYNDNYFLLDGSSRRFQMGDYTVDWFGTYIDVNDDGGIKGISLHAANGVTVNNLAGNGTGFVGVDNTGLLSFQTGLGTFWGLNGNAGTVPGTNFIGTTDAQELVFKVNSTFAGSVGNASDNTSFGLGTNENGNANTAIGRYANQSNSTGANNTAIGFGSIAFTNTSNNVSIGYNSGSNNRSGGTLTFMGAFADVTADGPSNATAIGYNAKVATSNSVVLGSGCNTYIGKDGAGLNGAILVDTAGVCWLVTVSTLGVLTTATITCP